MVLEKTNEWFNAVENVFAYNLLCDTLNIV